MSILKKVKSVLKDKDVAELQIDYEDGTSQEYNLEESGNKKKEINRILERVYWDKVKQVQYSLVDDDEDDYDDEDYDVEFEDEEDDEYDDDEDDNDDD